MAEVNDCSRSILIAIPLDGSRPLEHERQWERQAIACPTPILLKGYLARQVCYIQPSSFRVQDAFQTLDIFATLPSSFMVSA